MDAFMSRKPLSSQFNTSEAEKALKKWGIKYKHQPNGTLLVEGDIDINEKKLIRLPDLSCVIVEGNFNCSDNELRSLRGAPRSVSGTFWCSFNQLRSLEGAPRFVGGEFWCDDNRLTHLRGAPASVGGTFGCINNPLTSVEGAPKEFGKLWGDLGEFHSWDDVPQKLRVSRATRAKIAAREKAFREFTPTLKKPLLLPKSPFAKKPL